MRKSRLEWSLQRRLIEHFVSGSTARTAASLVGVNKKMCIRDRAWLVPGLEKFQPEGVRQQLAQCGHFVSTAFTWVEDEGVVVAELCERLAAGTAGHGGGVVEVGNGDRAQPQLGACLLYTSRPEIIGT